MASRGSRVLFFFLVPSGHIAAVSGGSSIATPLTGRRSHLGGRRDGRAADHSLEDVPRGSVQRGDALNHVRVLQGHRCGR